MKRLADLPNQEGFKFIGMDKENIRHVVEVKKDAIGCHSVYRTHDGEPFFVRLFGWENLIMYAEALMAPNAGIHRAAEGRPGE